MYTQKLVVELDELVSSMRIGPGACVSGFVDLPVCILAGRVMWPLSGAVCCTCMHVGVC